MKRIVLSTNAINSYGTRVLTEGMDISQYEKNPVMLYMHRRGFVIGYMKDIRKEEDGRLTGEPVFDEITNESKQYKKQFEFGSLRMASVCIDIIETSEEPKHLLPGQKYPTVTKSKLSECSIVDIGANDEALVMYRDGKQIMLGKDGTCDLPQIDNKPIINESKTSMETKALALSLGLAETATEAEITAKIAELSAAKTEAETLRAEKESLTLAAITSAVEKAIGERRIDAGKKEHFISLGKKVGVEELQKTIEAMSPALKPSETLHMSAGSTGAPAGAATYAKLSEVPADKIWELREKNRTEYTRLYKAEYGMEPKWED